MLRLFYLGTLLSKGEQTWPRKCFELAQTQGTFRGRMQNQWYETVKALLREYPGLECGKSKLIKHLTGGNQQGGLQNYFNQENKLVNLVAEWRQLVRKAISDRQATLVKLNGASRYLGLLSLATHSSLQSRQSVTRQPPTPENWILIRLLAGSAALNTMMHKITNGDRTLLSGPCVRKRKKRWHTF